MDSLFIYIYLLGSHFQFIMIRVFLVQSIPQAPFSSVLISTACYSQKARAQALELEF